MSFLTNLPFPLPRSRPLRLLPLTLIFWMSISHRILCPSLTAQPGLPVQALPGGNGRLLGRPRPKLGSLLRRRPAGRLVDHLPCPAGRLADRPPHWVGCLPHHHLHWAGRLPHHPPVGRPLHTATPLGCSCLEVRHLHLDRRQVPMLRPPPIRGAGWFHRSSLVATLLHFLGSRAPRQCSWLALS